MTLHKSTERIYILQYEICKTTAEVIFVLRPTFLVYLKPLDLVMGLLMTWDVQL